MIVTSEVGTGQLAELVKQVQAGNEVLLTDGDKTVARLVSAEESAQGKGTSFRIRALQGHRVLNPVVSQQELADEMFGQ